MAAEKVLRDEGAGVGAQCGVFSLDAFCRD